MRKIGKVTAIALAIVVGLFLVLILALPFIIDPNQYKDEIVQLVKDKTGRELRIDGEIGVTVFPWLGVELNKLSLSNAPGFGATPFASVEQAVVRIKLLPLLRKEIRAGKVRLRGVNANLAKNAQGVSNWADLTQPRAGAPTPGEDKTAAGDSAPPLAALSVEGLHLEDSALTWRDDVSGSNYRLHDINLKTRELRSGVPTDMQLAFDFESKPKTVSSVGGKKTGGGAPLRTRVELKSKFMFDLPAQKLNVDDLVLQLAGMKLTAAIAGTNIMDKPEFVGKAEIAPFNLRELLAKLGTHVDTADKNALRSASLSSQFTASGENLELKNLNASLDESKLNGAFSLRNFAKPAYRIDLALNDIDIDRYLAPPTPTGSAGGTTPPAAATPDPAATEATTVVALPLETLRALDLEGALRIQKLKAFSIRSSDVSLKIQAKNGLIALNPSQAKLYGGSYQGNMSFDARGKVPVLTMNETLKDVQVGPFLQDTQNFGKFTGKGNIEAKLNARGNNAHEWMATLAGTASFAIADGVLKGIDVRKMGREIEDTVKERRLDNLGALLPKADEQTPFEALRASAQIKDGVARNEDLDLQGAGLRVGGKGSVDLSAGSVDYVATVNGFPLKISGPFAALKYRPDWNAILKSSTDKRVQEEKEKLKQREDEIKDEAKQKLNKKLQDLLNR